MKTLKRRKATGKFCECDASVGDGGKCCICKRTCINIIILDPVDSRECVEANYERGYDSDIKHHSICAWPKDRKYRKQRQVCGDCARELVETELINRHNGG